MMKHIIATFAMAFLCLASYQASAQTTPSRPTMDKRNLVIKEWNTDVGTNIRYLDHETVYNAEGHKIKETEYTKTGKLWSKTFEYDASGFVVKEVTYNEYGKLDSIQKFEHNQYGKKTAVYTYDARGRLVKTKVVEYKVIDNVK